MRKAYSIFSKALILSLVMALPLSFFAQEEDGDKKASKKSSSFSPYWFVEGEIGPTWSHSDLSQYDFAPDFSRTNFNGAIGFGRQLTSVFSAYIDIERGFFEGEKKNVPTLTVPDAQWGRDMYFKADYYGANVNIGINLSNLISGYNERLVDFGLHAGFGQAHWQSQTFDLSTDDLIAGNGQKDVKSGGTGNGITDRNVDYTVPVGFSVTFNVNDKWDIYGDYSYTWMDTDYADGVVHGSLEVKNDVYSHFNIGARFKFGGNKNKKMAADFGKVQLEAIPSPLEERGDSIEVTIKGTFPPKYFDKKAVMNFTPVLKYEGGETAFETMNFKGEDVAGDGTLVSYANGGSFTYTSKIPYDPAMDVSNLVVAPVIYTYDGEIYDNSESALANGDKAFVAEERKLDDGVIHTSKYLRNTEILAWAPHAYEKVTISTVQSDLYFKVNRSALNWKLPLNKDEDNYDALKNNLSDMEKGWLLDDITIDGWASPEGEETFNEGLSERRAQTALKYMEKKIVKAAKNNELIAAEAIDFVVTSNGPDWNGFMKAVKSSDIKDKSAILNVINSADQAKKEEEIRNMILIYPEIERDILPPLRRADVKINTFVPKKTDAEMAKLSTTDPSALEMEELFYAATLTEDNGTKKVIYASIIEFYPKCWRSVNNAAAVELDEGNIVIAKELLDKGIELNENSFEIHNNMGVYYMMAGEYKKAVSSFNKARELGGDSGYNLGLAYVALGDYSRAESLLSGSSCDFNLGLAQLLNGNTSGAEKTFKCAPQDAETLYLLAITAARQDNKAGMLDYLGQSIKADKEVAAAAMTDREFLKYYSDADFMALVNMK
jgi:tetratricopeptide (TPR) repeat protein